MDSDPIEDTPAKRRRVEEDSEDEYGAHPFDDATATLLLDRPSPPAELTSPADFSSPLAPAHLTQPTQILHATSPTSNNKLSQILVPGTSPQQHPSVQRPTVSSSSPAPRLPPAIAPPGTNFRPPIYLSSVPAILSDSEEDHLMKSDSGDELGRSNADIEPTVFRTGPSQAIEDSQAAIRRFMSQYEYKAPNPRKRPADDFVSAYANASRPPARPVKQHAPSRAQPVEADIDPYEVIGDYNVINKINELKDVFPQFTYKTVWEAFLAKNRNKNDTLQYLAELADKETSRKNSVSIDLTQSDDGIGVASVRKPIPQPKPTSKRQLQGQHATLINKYSHSSRQLREVEEEDEEPVKRRRLVRGRRYSSPKLSQPQLPSSPPREVWAEPASITIDSGSDDSDVGKADDVGTLSREARLLKLVNTSTALDLMDIANCSKQDAELIITKRPFKSLKKVRRVKESEDSDAPKKGKGGSNKRGVGDRFVDVALGVLKGFEAVDRLVAECQTLGNAIKREMRTWGLKTSEPTEEITLGNLDDASSDSVSKNDSGVGTPRSSPQPERHSKNRAKSRFLQQPANMSSMLILKDYQIVGLNWLNLLWSKDISGILADEMGLGKTCQVISFLSHLLEIGKKGPHLVVCPSSTLENWARELNRFSPELKIEIFHGSKQERDDLAHHLINELKTGKDISSDPPFNVIVTTYEIARKKGSDHAFLRRLGFQTAIFDEGHMLKNSGTDRYRMLMNIPAQWRLLMTGTPLQNNLQELVSVLAFMMPDLFADCEHDLSQIFKHKAKASDEDHAALLSKERITRARSIMAPFVLRRRKEQVLKDLPTKHTRIEYCNMTPTQKELYDEYATEHQRLLAARAAGEKIDTGVSYLMLRRQAAIHPLLFRRHFDDKVIEKMASKVPKKGKYKGWSDLKTKEWWEWYSDFQLHQHCEQYPELSRFDQLKGDEWMDSGKVQKLLEILKKHGAKGDRTLVFSQFTTVLDILEAVFESAKITFSRIDGAVSVAERQDLIDQFAEDETIQVFMLSTKAGGTGINLACANKVVIFDSSFNPHDDIQAENRAHRIGQKREVEVVRLITKGTIEEQIHALGNSKLLLDERVSGEDETGDKVTKKAQKMIEDMLLKKQEDDVVIEEGAKGDLKDLFADGLRNAGVEIFS